MFAVKYPSLFRKNKTNSSWCAIFLGIVLSIFFVLGCNDGEKRVEPSDKQYFPLKVGFYHIYDIEETVYQLGVAESSTYQLKTVLSDSFPNGEGYTYVMHRMRRSNASSPWMPVDTWSVRFSGNRFIVSEGSIPYVVLQLPVSEGSSWNGNAYNDEVNPNTNTEEDIYTITSARTDCEVNAFSSTDCVAVLQEDNKEFIVYHDERRETYSRNVGLVFKEKIQLHYCNDEDRNCVGQQIIDDGIMYRQMISEYGEE